MIEASLLEQMLAAFNGLRPTDKEFEGVLAGIELYVRRAARLEDLDLSTVVSGRLVRSLDGNPSGVQSKSSLQRSVDSKKSNEGGS